MNGKRVFLIDAIKVFAIIAIITTHYPWEDPNSVVMCYVIDMAVPLFVLLSGYNLSSSYRKWEHDLLTVKFKWLWDHIFWFIIPYIPFFCVELLGNMYLGRRYLLKEIVVRLIEGGWGPGAYYIPMLMQLIIIFPLVHFLTVKWQEKAVFVIGAFNFLYEMIIQISGISSHLYAILIFRYLFIIALGCYLSISNKKINRWFLLTFFFIGSLFIYLTGCLNIQFPIFRLWTTTSMLTGLYFFPVIYILFKKCNCDVENHAISLLITIIGQNTYYIYLVQKTWYYSGITNLFLRYPVVVRLLINIIACTIIGVIYGIIVARFKRCISDEKI